MRKIAFFVEGYTEQHFIKEFFKAIFVENDIALETRKMKGGKTVAITSIINEEGEITDDTKYFILICDCGGETNVKSYILDQRISLLNAGYEKIVGVRDVYPNFTREEIHPLIYGLKYQVPQKDLPIEFILITMEIEAWFLAEDTHFKEISTTITIEDIIANYGFNPSEINTEMRDAPSNDLNSIYTLGGESYDKNKSSINRTISALDLVRMYFELPTRIPCLASLVNEINLLLEVEKDD